MNPIEKAQRRWGKAEVYAPPPFDPYTWWLQGVTLWWGWAFAPWTRSRP